MYKYGEVSLKINIWAKWAVQIKVEEEVLFFRAKDQAMATM